MPSISDIIAVTCPVCHVSPGQNCDSAFGGSYDVTSRGPMHAQRAVAAGRTISEVETVIPIIPGPPGTMDNVMAVTCPVCRSGVGQVCDGTIGGTYDSTSRGLIHTQRATLAGYVIQVSEVVS